jgi:large subunit ribosomal protein L25
MTNVVKLGAAKRGVTGSAAMRRLRRDGHVPAVLYGHGKAPVHLQLSDREFGDVYHRHAKFVELSFEGTVESALIRDVQLDVFGQRFVHIDFVRAALDEKLEIDLGVLLKGIPVGVSKQNGVLEQIMDHVVVLCAPRDLPESVEIDVSGLELGKSILVKDLPVLPGVQYVDDGERAVCHVSKVKIIEPVAAPAEAAEGAAEPEVVGAAGKEEAKEPAGD